MAWIIKIRAIFFYHFYHPPLTTALVNDHKLIRTDM